METLSEMFKALDTWNRDFGPKVPTAAPAAPTLPFECAPEGQLGTPESARQFILGGNATFTLRSKKTGTRFTYRVRASDDRAVFFVSLLNGPDNESHYTYFGYIRRDVFFHGGRKAKVGADASSAKAFAWVFGHLIRGDLPDTLEIWHEGRCGRCARKLTVPESVSSGFGPECITLI